MTSSVKGKLSSKSVILNGVILDLDKKTHELPSLPKPIIENNPLSDIAVLPSTIVFVDIPTKSTVCM